jgi:hypothetical protein
MATSPEQFKENEQLKADIQWQTIEKQKIKLEHQKQSSRLNLQTAHEYARAATRNIILGNGAALIALLSFLGQIWDKNSETFRQGVKYPSSLFLAGMFFGMIATGFAFCSTERWSRGTGKGRGWTIAAVALAVLGGTCFLIGAFLTLLLIQGRILFV